MLWHDLKVAVRTLSKSPTSTFVAVLSIGLAIGATAAVFSIVNALFAREIRVKSPDALVALGAINPDRPETSNPLSLSTFEELRRRNQDFAAVFAWRDALLRNVEANGVKFPGNVNEVSGDYFSALGVEPFLGRLLTPQDVASIGVGVSNRVAVLDYRCWEQRFGRDPNVIGKTLLVDGTPLTIVGVTSREFLGLNIIAAPDATVPIGFDTGMIPTEGAPFASLNYFVAARLREGIPPEQAAARLMAIWPSILEASVPTTYQGPQRNQFLTSRVSVESLRTGTTAGSNLRQQLRRPLTQLMGLSLLVVLVACVNLANLMLTRATARRHQLGLRASLGATTWTLVRSMAVEGTLVALAGVALGLVTAVWLSPLLLQMLLAAQSLKPLALDPRPDLRVIALGGAVALLVGIVSTLAPAWRVVRRDPTAAIIPNARIVGTRALLQKILVCAQVALALVLTTAALLFGRSLYNLTSIDPGFRVEGVLQMRLFPLVKQQAIPNRTAYYHAVVDKLSSIPGVDGVSYSQPSPLTGQETLRPVFPSGSPNSAGAVMSFVGPDFFRTMGMTVAGREFEWRDDERAPRVAVISQTLASQLFPGSDPIGQHIDVSGSPYGKGLLVVGIVNNANLWRLQSRAPSAVFMALMQAPAYNMFSVQLHANANLSNLAPIADKAIQSFGYQYSFLTEPLKQQVKYVLRDERVISSVSVFLAVVTVLLASVGLYGLLSYAVAVRRSEIGIRMAIGAQRSDIAMMVLKEATLLVAIGVAVGVPMALIAIRLGANLIFGLKPYDPLTFGTAVAALAVVTFVAAYFPARRASRMDPLSTLRAD
jgi:putative ABC transport system permease protein